MNWHGGDGLTVGLDDPKGLPTSLILCLLHGMGTALCWPESGLLGCWSCLDHLFALQVLEPWDYGCSL